MKARRARPASRRPAFLLILLLLGGIAAVVFFPDWRPALAHPARSPIAAVTSGTFTQPWCVDRYTTQAQWDREFETMRAAGIELWIYQWTADSGQKTTIYPTRLAGYRHAAPGDQVEMALAAAQRHQVQVFLGLAFNDAWWQKEGADRDWLMAEAAAMNAVASELYENYYPRYADVFAGWYLNWEMDNVSGYNFLPAHRQNMRAALQAVTGHLKTLNPDLPTSIAPFFNASLGAGPRRWQYFWYDLLRQTDVDIVMLQDGVGVGHATVQQLPQWFQAVCDGVHAAGKQCWSDLENFTQVEAGFIPGPPERVAAQHQAVAALVDRIVTFSFIAYMSPVYGVDPGYLEAYQAYRSRLPGR